MSNQHPRALALSLGRRDDFSRSSLARVNAEQPYTRGETLFGRLLSRCQQCAPRHGFRFKNKLYAVDATTIDLCLAVFPWASFRRRRPRSSCTSGWIRRICRASSAEFKTGDVKAARTWTFPAGSVVVADRAYLDFKRFHQLQARGVTFVTRLKRGVRYRVTREHDIRPGTASSAIRRELTSARTGRRMPRTARVAYQDPVTKNRYVFVTNNTTWVAQTIADIYKRWQIELFFKWIKQHLKVKRFVGRSKNAVMTQLWVGDVHVPAVGVPEVRHAVALEPSPDAEVLQLNMFERRPLQDLFTTPSLPAPSGSQLSAGVVLKMPDTSDMTCTATSRNGYRTATTTTAALPTMGVHGSDRARADRTNYRVTRRGHWFSPVRVGEFVVRERRDAREGWPSSVFVWRGRSIRQWNAGSQSCRRRARAATVAEAPTIRELQVAGWHRTRQSPRSVVRYEARMVDRLRRRLEKVAPGLSRATGPCGYGLHGQLERYRVRCDLIAPLVRAPVSGSRPIIRDTRILGRIAPGLTFGHVLDADICQRINRDRSLIPSAA